MRSRIIVGMALGALGAAACASGGAAGGSAQPTSVSMEAGGGQLGPAFLQWTGRFRPTEVQTGDVAYHPSNQVTGSVTLTAPAANQTHVRLTVEGPMTDPDREPWSVSPGPCHSGTIPLLTVAQFPEITMSNGRGTLDVTFSMTLPTSGTYHVNVYNSGSTADESGVWACAELKLEHK